MNNYIMSNIKKFELLFWNEEISNLIFIFDKEDKERLDQVLFMEKNNDNIVGLYINGMNPMYSLNHFDDFDDFNLYASYDELSECNIKDFNKFKIRLIKLIFNSEYNELCGLFLSSADESNSIFLLFMQDAIHLELGCNKSDIKRILNENFLHMSEEQYVTYEKSDFNDLWC